MRLPPESGSERGFCRFYGQRRHPCRDGVSVSAIRARAQGLPDLLMPSYSYNILPCSSVIVITDSLLTITCSYRDRSEATISESRNAEPIERRLPPFSIAFGSLIADFTPNRTPISIPNSGFSNSRTPFSVNPGTRFSNAEQLRSNSAGPRWCTNVLSQTGNGAHRPWRGGSSAVAGATTAFGRRPVCRRTHARIGEGRHCRPNERPFEHITQEGGTGLPAKGSISHWWEGMCPYGWTA